MARFSPPDPPLVDPAGRFRLRQWTAPDAAALAAAWSDPEIRRWCAVPADPTPTGAAAWIEGWSARADQGAALDLVVADLVEDRVLGEVGIARLHRSATDATGAFELGWWLVEGERGRGLAATAVGLVADWLQAGGATEAVVARIPDGHVASERVARAAGLVRRGALADGRALWNRPQVAE